MGGSGDPGICPFAAREGERGRRRLGAGHGKGRHLPMWQIFESTDP